MTDGNKITNTTNRNSFDTVVASHILEHISDMGVALAEIRRVLARGGSSSCLFRHIFLWYAQVM